MNPELLIATNGFKGTWPAIEYGAWLAQTLPTKLTLLGVTEELSPAAIDEHHPLEDVFERAVRLFQENGVEYTLEVENGPAEQIIPRRAHEKDFITLLGPLGRPQLRRWLMRRSIHYLMEQIEGPILYVPQACLPLKRVLICIGGLGYEVTAEHLGMQMAMNSNAEITLLHVVPPVDMEYPTTREELEHWQSLMETDTPVGRSLRQAMNLAKANGLTTTAKSRQGNIVEQILAEIRTDQYELICMGSAYSGNSLRQLYTPNVTAEVTDAGLCPVLTARYKREE
jgi:nucleotide-binding universal stress UspA family protein